MARATTGEWGQYYAEAKRRRSTTGGDPLKRYFERLNRRERALFVVSALSLVGLVGAFCSVLIW